MKPAALNRAYWSCRWAGRAGSRLQTESNVPVKKLAQPRTIPILALHMTGPIWRWRHWRERDRQEVPARGPGRLRWPRWGFCSWLGFFFLCSDVVESRTIRGDWMWLRCWINHRKLSGGHTHTEAECCPFLLQIRQVPSLLHRMWSRLDHCSQSKVSECCS